MLFSFSGRPSSHYSRTCYSCVLENFCRSDTDIAIAIMDHSTFNRHCTNYFASRIVILATAIQPDPLWNEPLSEKLIKIPMACAPSPHVISYPAVCRRYHHSYQYQRFRLQPCCQVRFGNTLLNLLTICVFTRRWCFITVSHLHW